jgi:uncharacterized protein YlxW (UPF0749 family)
MIRSKQLWSALFVAVALLLMGRVMVGQAQSTGKQATTQVTPDQQKQLDQLKEIENQLQKDRTDLHDAITKYGWDSDQVDAAQNQLTQDRTEYRKLRRALVQAGVSVPSPAGFAPGGGMGPGRGMRAGRGSRGAGYQGCPCPDCPCCRR